MQNIIVTIGLPGSGKSTWVKQHADATHFVVCRDDIRQMGCAGSYLFLTEREPMIKEMRNRIVMSALDAGYNVIIDETMLTRKSRAELRMFPARYFHGVYFDTPVDVCIERRLRDTKGGSDDWEEIITNMNKTFEQPALCEFDLITVIKGGQHGSMPSL